MVEICNPTGQVIRRSRNLRGVLDHARRVGLWAAVAYPLADGKGALRVSYADASVCRVEFASFEVLCHWLRSRRAWAGARRINGSGCF